MASRHSSGQLCCSCIKKELGDGGGWEVNERSNEEIGAGGEKGTKREGANRWRGSREGCRNGRGEYQRTCRRGKLKREGIEQVVGVGGGGGGGRWVRV